MKLLLNVYDWLQKNVRPPSAFSWETLILLSLFSAYMAFLASDFVETLLNNFAWIFLILGVFWATTPAKVLRYGYKDPQNPGFPISPWITGALVSLYIFVFLWQGEDELQAALIAWPIISAIIAALPAFWREGFRFKIPPPQQRQNLVLLFTTQILLSCWFQFYFVVQGWLEQYPSLLADDFQQSAFVVKRDVSASVTPRGALVLNAMEPKLEELLDARPWSEVERLLLPQQREVWINEIAQQSKEQISPVDEDLLWQVAHKVSTVNSGYNLELQAIWLGPRSELRETYLLTKSCQISQVAPGRNSANNPTNPQPAQISNFKCQPVAGWGIDDPTLVQAPFIKR